MEMDAPEWLHNALQWYGTQDVDIQLAINVAVILYLLGVQYYFFRYLICDTCIREYKQLNAEVAESARTLDARREEYKKQMEWKDKQM